MINPGTVLQDRYLIEKRIGEGGMGAVYLAIDQRFDNFVAIKETFYSDREFGEAFEREAKILNGLLHPVLPHVSDYFTEGDEHFLVMQYIEGEDASDILKREGAFPMPDVLRWTDNLLDALEYLHSQEPPIIHRDLKPSNLKITPRGDIFLLDFGLAKLKKENTLSERSVFGYSRRYSPLEQIQGTGTDARSDIFALAATVYHLLTGTPPLDAIARASAIVAGKPDPLELASTINKEIPASVASVLNSALALNAENRFASASAMRKAIKHAVMGTALENPAVAAMDVPLINSDSAPRIIDSAENVEFPALEAFAAESSEIPQVEALENVPPVEDESPLADIPIYAPTVTDSFQKAGDVPTRVAPRAGRSRFPVAALAALLLIVLSVSAVMVFKNRKSGDVVPTPAETTASEPQPDKKSTETAPDLAVQNTVDAPENVDKIKAKPVSAKKTAEKAETDDEIVVDEVLSDNPHPKSAKIENKRVAKKSKSTDIDRRERIVENEPVPDIESIFTGRPNWEREEKIRRQQQRRQRIDSMSDEEFREMRRRRRQQRRQNDYPIPF